MSRSAWIALGAIFVLTEIAGFVGDGEHVFGFYALFGVVGSVLFVLLAKGGKRFLMRKETEEDA